MEYEFIKRNRILIYATTWMNLEYIKLSERSQTQKATYCLIPLMQNNQNQNRQIQRNQKQISGCQRMGGMRTAEWLLNRFRVPFCGDEMFWNEIVLMDAHHCEYTNGIEFYNLKWLISCCVHFTTIKSTLKSRILKMKNKWLTSNSSDKVNCRVDRVKKNWRTGGFTQETAKKEKAFRTL